MTNKKIHFFFICRLSKMDKRTKRNIKPISGNNLFVNFLKITKKRLFLIGVRELISPLLVVGLNDTCMCHPLVVLVVHTCIMFKQNWYNLSLSILSCKDQSGFSVVEICSINIAFLLKKPWDLVDVSCPAGIMQRHSVENDKKSVLGILKIYKKTFGRFLIIPHKPGLLNS